MDTLRGCLSDTVNVINKLLLTNRDTSQRRILRHLRDKVYFRLWEAVIKQEIDSKTDDFKNAIEALKAAAEDAEEAITDVEKVAKAIEKAVNAAKAVDKIVKIGVQYLS